MNGIVLTVDLVDGRPPRADVIHHGGYDPGNEDYVCGSRYVLSCGYRMEELPWGVKYTTKINGVTCPACLNAVHKRALAEARAARKQKAKVSP